MRTTDETGPWDVAAFDQLANWAPAMSAALEKLTIDPWTGALDRKTVERRWDTPPYSGARGRSYAGWTLNGPHDGVALIYLYV